MRFAVARVHTLTAAGIVNQEQARKSLHRCDREKAQEGMRRGRRPATHLSLWPVGSDECFWTIA